MIEIVSALQEEVVDLEKRVQALEKIVQNLQMVCHTGGSAPVHVIEGVLEPKSEEVR